MKVNFNQTLPIYKYQHTQRTSQNQSVTNDTVLQPETLLSPSLSLANFPNVSFSSRITKGNKNHDMLFLLSQVDKLKCAYSRKPMIASTEAKKIYAKLDKRSNAQAAINYLEHCEKYMHEIESQIFDMFKEAPHKGKQTFQTILQDLKPDALVRLKSKQIAILTDTNKYISKMSEPIAQQVIAVRDEALQKVEDDTFGRKSLLEKLKLIKAEGTDLLNVIKVYQAWYKFPRSTNDVDAFIVQYSKEPHEAIAKRLISTAVATVEHVKPQARGGEDSLSNFLLVSARFNNERDTMPLDEYIKLNDEVNIKVNLQKYMDDVIHEVNNKKSTFSTRSYYPKAITLTVQNETNNLVELETKGLRVTKAQIRDGVNPDRLSQRFIVKRK